MYNSKYCIRVYLIIVSGQSRYDLDVFLSDLVYPVHNGDGDLVVHTVTGTGPPGGVVVRQALHQLRQLDLDITVQWSHRKELSEQRRNPK